ncbi:MAG: Rrf2 family transcriptional regulator [Planctomycetota bacterium]
MLSLTKKTDYALIGLAHLAKQTNATVSARELARTSRVPLPILTNILKALAHSGLVASERGSTGGYALAKAADSITLYDLVTAIEGPVQLVQCAANGNPAAEAGCELIPWCPIRLPAQRVHDRLADFLRGVTLSELAAELPGPGVVFLGHGSAAVAG